ncbi:MAG: DUF2161 family putative PD-(D/E)XK-type phosphodiesterase [Defluviitaleaceae bacterium]|nr:DUF2161 family putative PD-(D/E)XK-type phosphodiesterase [Defluviitaleaceae bacterium]
MGDFREEDMYGPIKRFFEAREYVVKGEVARCDIVLVKGDETVIVELKKAFNMTLLYQALDRQKISNLVYIAIPLKAFMMRRGHILHILEKMGIGLVTVAMDSALLTVEAHLLPNMTHGRLNKRTKALLAEFNGRTFDGNLGGATRRKLLTAHRERALHIACVLEKITESSIAMLLRDYNCHKNTTHMLPRNLYGWFTKVKTGVYALSDDGRAALDDPQFAEIVAHYRKDVEEAVQS